LEAVQLGAGVYVVVRGPKLVKVYQPAETEAFNPSMTAIEKSKNRVNRDTNRSRGNEENGID
jgi:pyruvate/2-oxoacid:ferredoxin oxidoreductase beta subunit